MRIAFNVGLMFPKTISSSGALFVAILYFYPITWTFPAVYLPLVVFYQLHLTYGGYLFGNFFAYQFIYFYSVFFLHLIKAKRFNYELINYLSNKRLIISQKFLNRILTKLNSLNRDIQLDNKVFWSQYLLIMILMCILFIDLCIYVYIYVETHIIISSLYLYMAIIFLIVLVRLINRCSHIVYELSKTYVLFKKLFYTNRFARVSIRMKFKVNF